MAEEWAIFSKCVFFGEQFFYVYAYLKQPRWEMYQFSVSFAIS